MTAIEDFRPFIRLLLGDLNDDIPEYEGYQIDRAVKMVLSQGLVDGYAVSGEYVSPDLTMESDGLSYAKLAYNSAKVFAVALTDSSFNMRAYSERLGKPTELVGSILDEVYRMAHGDMAW